MKKFLFVTIFTAFILSSGSLFASDTNPNFDLTKTPWLEGVDLESVPKYITPVIPMVINLQSGEEFPKVITEDEPIYLLADSDIFFDNPPTKDRDMEIPNPAWESKCDVSWRIIDWEINKSVTCTSNIYELDSNTMEVIPVQPTSKGAIVCFVGREMSYDLEETGRRKHCFANSSVSRRVKVKDITPPTCGLQISVEGSSATVYPVENPPNLFPLPKTADLIVKGGLVNGNSDYEEVVSGVVLGPDMIAPEETFAIPVTRGAVVKLTVIGEDNYKLDTNKLKYGICAGAGGEPTPVCQENQPEYDLAAIKLPQKPYFYLDATDMEGNREVLFIPIKIVK
jgi:hypothetical protein